MEVRVSEALGISSGSCHQDNCMFAPLLESQASNSSGGDRHVLHNHTISHSVSWSSSLASSVNSGGTTTETNKHSVEWFALNFENDSISRSLGCQAPERAISSNLVESLDVTCHCRSGTSSDSAAQSF
ncbi:hypothetical protein JOB18_026938 [Solea senegalensis]|uniref:Uncharacterized protein n=1 Tax=Solea senegalensis TaxID=28829 RepID=A0AAV6SZU0_SOLSE|nr:hypothetical protein JOB18_026938 [Solea senegalensis]